MKKIKRISILILLMTFLNSCFTVQELKVDPVQQYDFKGFENNRLKFNITLSIENPNSQNIIISEINLKAYINNVPLGSLEMTDKFIILKKSKHSYEIPLVIQISNVLGSISLLSAPSKSLEKLKFEGFIKVRKGAMIKKIKIDKETSDQYLKF